MTDVDDLVTWLGAQLDARERELDEDERVASDAAGLGASRRHWTREALSCVVDATDNGLIVYGEGMPTPEQADHIARWDPARVLRKVETGRAEVDATRRVLDWLVDCEGKALDGNWWNLEVADAVMALALPFADRPGYRDEWRPAR